jgi:cell wall-associated NlpC family hydrolase
VNIDLTEFEQPIRIAAQKLKSDTGAATKAQNDLSSLSTSLTEASNRHKADSDKLRGNWEGEKGQTFGDRAKEKTDALTEASGWADRTAKSIGDASTLIQQAEKEVDGLLREFDTDARAVAAAVPDKDRGAVAQARAIISGMASRYAKEAADVVNAAKARLAEIVSQLGGTHPSSTGGNDGPLGSRSSGGGGGGGGGNTGSSGPAVLTPPSDQYGSGTQVRLPGGQTVDAPNERAAIAVRAALSRLGLPYVWGGTDPDKGMDCSGLTQWAYGQAGVKLPRTAATQTIGQKVDINDIQPGDLIIWSGHVAMYIGNGQMVEEPHTGSVCHVVPLRTSNAGEPLLGVFRPSA